MADDPWELAELESRGGWKLSVLSGGNPLKVLPSTQGPWHWFATSSVERVLEKRPDAKEVLRSLDVWSGFPLLAEPTAGTAPPLLGVPASGDLTRVQTLRFRGWLALARAAICDERSSAGVPLTRALRRDAYCVALLVGLAEGLADILRAYLDKAAVMLHRRAHDQMRAFRWVVVSGRWAAQKKPFGVTRTTCGLSEMETMCSRLEDQLQQRSDAWARTTSSTRAH